MDEITITFLEHKGQRFLPIKDDYIMELVVKSVNKTIAHRKLMRERNRLKGQYTRPTLKPDVVLKTIPTPLLDYISSMETPPGEAKAPSPKKSSQSPVVSSPVPKVPSRKSPTPPKVRRTRKVLGKQDRETTTSKDSSFLPSFEVPNIDANGWSANLSFLDK